jgi:hypothetical protein
MSTHNQRRSSLCDDPGFGSDDGYSIPGTPVLGELIGPHDHWWLSGHGVNYPAMTIQQLEDQATNDTSGDRLTVTSEWSRHQAILLLLSDATSATRQAVSESLLRDASHAASLKSLLFSMENTQLKMQQAHPDQEHVYRCKKYPAHTMHKLLNNRDLEFGDIVHPHPHDWLIVPTWLKVNQLRGKETEEGKKCLDYDYQIKFDHGVNSLIEKMEAAKQGEDCACQRWYTYTELEDLTGLKVVCKVGRYVPSLLLCRAIIITPKHLYSQVQIDAIVFKCLAHFYDDNAKELPSRIEGILSCTELKERNKHLYGNPA